MNLPNNTFLQGGKYKIIRFISAGGFGCTYEGELCLLHKRVAIKEFFVKDFCNRDELTNHVSVGTQSKIKLVERLRGKFLEEAGALYSMAYPNIVRVTDVFEENDTAYYVMDYVDGFSLYELVKQRGTLPEAQAIKYITQVAKALKYVHAQNRLHLDLKPGNIMINARDNAILIDFGASKQYDEVDGENTSTILSKTPGYAPIEQISNSVKHFTPATDIYALGAAFYKLLIGITPPDATEIFNEGLEEIPNTISKSTQNAILKAMELRVKDRPQTIDEFLSLLLKQNNVIEDANHAQLPEQKELPLRENTLLIDSITVDFNSADLEAIDLGLNVKWANCNIGAKYPHDMGSYFEWKKELNWKTDSKWKLPSKTDFQELLLKCKWYWNIVNDISGYKIIGSNGNSIFMPAASFCNSNNVCNSDFKSGLYWSSGFNEATDEGYYLYFDEEAKEIRNTRKYFRFSLRVVCD